MWKKDKFTSLTVSPSLNHTVTLEYGDDVWKWTFSVLPCTSNIVVRGQLKPELQPSKTTLEAMQLLSDDEVFPCEAGTRYLYQDENLIIALGQTPRYPLKMEPRSASMLLISWQRVSSASPASRVSLYHPDTKAYVLLTSDTTHSNYYRFTGLDSCSPYAACVEREDTHTLTCLYDNTGPDMPRNFQVVSWNVTSITVAWDCPDNNKFSLFLVTAFYLNGSDYILEERYFRHTLKSFVFTLLDLQPCSRVKFGLQTVCEFDTGSHSSRMVLIDGNTVHSDIHNLHQSSSGPGSYTLTWEVKNISTISAFRVYHQGALHASTLLTTHTVDGLEPCQYYLTRVEAMCGDSMVMSWRSITVCSGTRGVSDLKYHSENSTALWTADAGGEAVFQYQLSYTNSSIIQKGSLTETMLPLPGLIEGARYVLDVWEECNGEMSANQALLVFNGINVPLRPLDLDFGLELDDPSPVLVLVVPWLLPEPLHSPTSEPRATLQHIIEKKLEELLKDFPQKARVQLDGFRNAGQSNTNILFSVFDALITDTDVPLLVGDLLDHVQSLQVPSVSVNNGIIYWDDPDECSTPDLIRCPSHSLCINTLDSYTCVCHPGYYDVRSPLTPLVDLASGPVCYEHGTFTQCLHRRMAGGVSKAFLTAYLGGDVTVLLNDGRCAVNESETLYHFSSSNKAPQCGTERLVNMTHIEFQNSLTVTLNSQMTITRRDLKVIWKCVYPRTYILNVRINVDQDRVSSHSVVVFNSSHSLFLTMSLYSDLSYSHGEPISITQADALFFEVALQTAHTFTPEVLLKVLTCWATESPAPNNTVGGIFLLEGCPVDSTFHWLSLNGVAQRSRFSLQMFTMPRGLPIYFHCLAHICRHDEDCTTNCTAPRLSKRSVSQRNVNTRQVAVVSAGPLVVSLKAKPDTKPSDWDEMGTLISVVGGTVGLFLLAVLGAIASKAIMKYYKRPRLQ
ncbi:uncharacterized protein LOC134037857 isoform X2 [Osmerus eperlanus]